MLMTMTAFADVRAVLFDLDGTLIDSAPDLAGAVEDMRAKRGLPALDLSVYRPMAGAGARGMLGVGFGLAPDDPGFATLREEFFQSYERRLTLKTRVFDGVSDVIQRLEQQQLPWGVVTNKASRFTEPLTLAIALFDSASVIISGDSTAYSKPHPEPLLEAARRIGIAPGHCVYVGDDERDIVAGQAAGMNTVAVAYGYLGVQADLHRWGADAVVNYPGQLLQLLALA